MRRSAIAGLLAVAGCSQIFGLESPEHATDAPAPTVTGRLYVRYPHHDAAHEIVVDEAQLPLTRVFAVLSDGTKSEVAVDASGQFAFETRYEGERYGLQIYSPLFPVLELQHDARTLDVPHHRFVRPDAQIAAAGTQLTYSLPITLLPGASYRVVSTGQWMTAFVPPGATTPLTIGWDLQNARAANDDMLMVVSAGAGDLIYFTESLALADIVRLERYRVDEIEMMNAGNTSISGALLAVNRDRCTRIQVAFGTELARQTTAGFTGTQFSTWSLQSYPSLDVGILDGPTIATNRINQTSDFALDFSYGNPFGGAPVLLGFMGRLRTFANVTSLVAGTLAVVPVQDSCEVATKIAPDVTLPSAIMLDGKPLDVDGKQLVVDRTRPLELTWTRGGSGRSHRTIVSLREVADGSVVANWITTTDVVRIDPAVLDIGKSYVFVVTEQLGFPKANTGDMKPAMPHVEGFIYSGTFVAN